nr:MAG TPA: hypothetical protein [Caudoviricetes sp.]DAO67674.1 MAG TPA: hypothetical protein [Bacteriophage sp.]DAO91216.1 MAG TPA: hypothetical protein [Caudoviricetes sp.]
MAHFYYSKGAVVHDRGFCLLSCMFVFTLWRFDPAFAGYLRMILPREIINR